MSLHIVYFEDLKINQFRPLTDFRPIYTLRAGIMPLYKRSQKYFPDSTVTLTCRNDLAPVLCEQIKDVPINIIKKYDAPILFLNGRIRDYGDLPKLISKAKDSTAYYSNDELAAVYLSSETLNQLPQIATINEYNQFFDSHKENIIDFHTTATLYNYCWELMADVEKEIIDDFKWLEKSFPAASGVKVHDGVFWVNMENVYLGNNVEIMPGAVIDASSGPVYIGDNTKVESHAAVYGPASIGGNSLILRGKITSSSIGHTCRVGGEVEWSIFHSYVNKYHDGFIGHSYVGSWVNFGAMTTNSDLKNNYSQIRTRLNGKAVDTDSNKIGSFIGDHTKFGIGTLLNTGIQIGSCCNLFGGTLITDKEVKSFQWGSTGNYKNYDVEKAIETAKIVYNRRGITFSEFDEKLIRILKDNNQTTNGILLL